MFMCVFSPLSKAESRKWSRPLPNMINGASLQSWRERIVLSLTSCNADYNIMYFLHVSKWSFGILAVTATFNMAVFIIWHTCMHACMHDVSL